jgi:hypothetical protein
MSMSGCHSAGDEASRREQQQGNALALPKLIDLS